MADTPLTPAPGAKAAQVCGILAIVLALTCVGFPIAIILGIVALVQHAKAKRLAKAQPDLYQPVPATGLVTGIVGLALSALMLPFLGLASAIAIPAFLQHRDRARELAVQANLEAARKQAELAVLDLQARAPGRMPSQDAIIRALATDPLILALRNPVTPTVPAFQHGTSGPLGTVMVYGDQAQEGGVTTWSIQFRAVLRRGGQDQTLEGAVITHTQQQVVDRPGNGPEVAPTPAEPPIPAEPLVPAEPPSTPKL